MPSIAVTDISRMRERLLFDGPARQRKLTAYWTLLLLSAVIAAAGVIADSTATVIGAMIVAPLMTPILAIVLCVTIGDGRNLALATLLVVLGAVSVIVVGYLLGLLAEIPVDAATSSQVAGRVNPRIIDLVAAVATGAVGAFALVRDDVSDTLPGVAIAISLVPPLAVVGLTLEAGEGGQAIGALLLFLTNVSAILVTGVVVMAIYRVRRTAGAPTAASGLGHRAAVATIVLFLVAVAVPLAGSTARIVSERLETSAVTDIATAWAAERDWEIVHVDLREGAVVIRAVGQPPSPEPRDLRARLDAAGHAGADVRLELVPEAHIELAGGG